MKISTKPIYVSSEVIATTILVESGMAPNISAAELRKRVLHAIRLRLEVNGFTGLNQWFNEARGYSFLNRANLETCYKVATKLIEWDAIGSIDRILQPKPLNEVPPTFSLRESTI